MSGRILLTLRLGTMVSEDRSALGGLPANVAGNTLQTIAPPVSRVEGPRVQLLRTREIQGQGSCLKNEHRDLVLVAY